MKISVSFTLWLLLGFVSPIQSNGCQPSYPQDIYAALREMTASLVQLKADMTLQTQEQATNLKTEVKKLKTEVDKLKQQQLVRQVAFSASLAVVADTTLGPVHATPTLIFKHVPTNIGNAYNSNTGAFTAPVRGAYNFQWSIGAHGDGSHGSGATLVKNSENVFTVYQNQAEGFMSSSNGVTLLLEVGDVVSVLLVFKALAFDNGNHYTTFSGHLLFPM